MNGEKLYVQREAYTVKTGEEYYKYFIKGLIRGREVTIQLAPPDREKDFGGYTVLDIVFNGQNKAELVVNPYELKDANGKVICGNTYSVMSVDDDGEVYECKIKPFKTSDKILLKMLLG